MAFDRNWNYCKSFLILFLLNKTKFKETQKFNFQTAVLSCICNGQNLLYTSTFNSGPILCDTRSGIKPIKTLNIHKGTSVFNMTSQVNFCKIKSKNYFLAQFKLYLFGGRRLLFGRYG